MESVRKNMIETSEAIRKFADSGSQSVAGCAEAIVKCLKAGGKVLVCGNGGSAAQAQHFAAELVGRFESERTPWAAVALSTDTSILTSVGNDYGFDDVFVRQVRALGKSGDVLIGISTSGRSPNVVKAIKKAREMGMVTVGLTGQGGSVMAPLVDLHVDVPESKTYRIQEVHLAALHQVCRLVEEALAGGGAA